MSRVAETNNYDFAVEVKVEGERRFHKDEMERHSIQQPMPNHIRPLGLGFKHEYAAHLEDLFSKNGYNG